MNTTQFNDFANAMAAALSSRHTGSDSNSEEIRLYINKLKDLVPACPKSTSVSKLEVIQHAIDYIGDLQDTLHSDSESDSSPPVSPMEDLHFSDGFNQALQFHGYGSQPQDTRCDSPSSSSSGPDYGYGDMDTCSSGSALNDGYDQPIMDDYNKPLYNGFSGYSSSSTTYDNRYRSNNYGGFNSSS